MPIDAFCLVRWNTGGSLILLIFKALNLVIIIFSISEEGVGYIFVMSYLWLKRDHHHN